MSEAPVALRFSHVGLFVTEMARMLAFYRDRLGFIVTDEGRLGDATLAFLSRDAREHHQLVLVEGRPPGIPDRIVNQVSFRVATLGDLVRFWRGLRDAPPRELVAVTHGNAWSIYFRDPEGNRIEVFADTPWHVSQPVREPIDLDRDETAILADTEALCRARPGFRPMAEWQQEVAARLAAAAENATP
ncbi:MAG TPA: VOC family protein [Stellaceae bacterium]|jgi:catechol-2,3-dioxygenase|nr:VOC family protein [Stellaceae bacterium]